MPWQNSPEDRRRSSATYGAAWRRARLACLQAARWRCEIRLPGVCIGAAAEVDHILGAASDPGHTALRAACRPCHARITATQGNDTRRGRRTEPPPEQRTAW